jgi:RNA polymerase sigma-70 factor (ECF subfamily)
MKPGSAAVSTSRELERLLLRMSSRDEAAFKKLHAATRRKLFFTILPLVKRSYLAEEILQEAYVRIWMNAGAYRPGLSTPMVWMITIARNLAIDTARKSTREFHFDASALSGIPAEDPTALESMEIRENESDTVKLQQRILCALHALEPTRRHMVIAAYLYGESRHRLSERYGVPVNTIKTQIRRALLEVRASIQNPVVDAPRNQSISHGVVDRASK